MITAGEGKYRVFLEEREIGDDLVLFLYGGEKPHAGVVVIAEPGKETKILKSGTHKDDVIAVPIAEKKRDLTGKKVVCIAGIHVENATEEEIKTLIENCENLKELL